MDVVEDKSGATTRRRGVLRTWSEYLLAWSILHLIGILPRSLALFTGRCIASIVRIAVPRLSRHAEINLQLALPQISEAERSRIKSGVFANLGRLLGEVSRFKRLTPDNISSIVVYEGIENFIRAKAEGRGVLLLTGHIGAWELSVFAHSIYGHPMSFLARRVDNPLVEQLAEKLRSKYGNRSIDKRGSVREVLRTLKEGGCVGVLADLNATREEGVFVDFFGLKACTTAGVATLALRTGAVVLPGYIIWDKKARIHRLHFDSPIPTVDTGNQRADIITNTAQYSRALESIIRKHPDQWLWIHRRWRTRPEGEPAFY
jgi:Kdo2-lipid IVA lauroyltransferase/acyltransferase